MKIFLYVFMFLVFMVNLQHRVTANTGHNDVKSEKDSNAEPRIVFEEETYDFGKVFSGEKVTHKFKFKNIGSGLLVVGKVKSSCGCTAALASKKKFKKGEEGEIKVTFKSGRYVGNIRKTVIVKSNDPKRPRYKLTIKCNIIKEVMVRPSRINFGNIRLGDSSSKDIEISILPESDIKILKVETQYPQLKIAKKKGNDTTHKYTVTYTGGKEYGKFHGYIFIHTDSKKRPRVNVPFTGEIIGDISYYPKKLSFGVIKEEQHVEKSVIITFINKKVEIKEIKIKPEYATYTIDQLNNDSKIINVGINKKDIKEDFVTGNLMIFTNSDIQPMIYIPVLAKKEG